ncbi:ATP-dependent helicase HrpB [Leucobacter sp. OAMSW11]|uniref:ATP-dependent helicase HrpB n=1 Tax=Leucobacter sp. OAMSW11 TaxID=1933287 RepID=UPI000C19E8C7|nr:ATP-dependent helicase HrpB [Leucobacter sp. OAMSW11]PIJ57491.1 ATP-dependent helicase HrpB [Leucobacter sp. OAMSW11]
MSGVPIHRFDLDAIGAGLVVARADDELRRALARGAAVVTAPPGTGKTTFVPPLVANLLAQGGSGSARHAGRTILTQPRRVAARASAARLAELDRSAIGEHVGFTVRGERRAGRDARIEVVTPGVLLRRLIADPELDGVGAVILDEVHERSLDGDLLLGLVAEVRALRDDLLVVAMSATLDADRVAELLGAAAGDGPAPIVRVPSALHPLRVEHAPFDGARLDERGITRDYLAHLADVAADAQAGSGADALVFVPGAREVDEVVNRLRGRVSRSGASVDVLPLHGRLSPREQDRAVRGRLRDADPHRIVVSTALAESALTVPGVRLVIDSGLSREVRRDQARDMTGLVTVSASRASAEQRAGRAARQGPGTVVRAYSEAEFARMPAELTPEIATADLSDTALLLAAWGAPAGRGLALLTPPPAAAMDRAVAVLAALDLVDASGSLTELGARVARLPIGVREARALLAGTAELGDARRTAEVVAAISDDHRASDADLARLLRELRSGRAPGAERWKRETERLSRLAGEGADPATPPSRRMTGDGPSRRTTGDGSSRGTTHDDAGVVTALARPEWIARRTGAHSRSYLLASGTRAALPEGSPLLGSEWIAVREVQRAEGRAADGTGAAIRLAAVIAEDDALRLGAHALVEERTTAVVDGRIRVRLVRRLGAIPLASTPAAARPDDTGPAFAAHLRELGLDALDWSEAAQSLRGRLALLHRELGGPWPDVSDAALLDRIDAWLGPDLERLRPGGSLRGIDLPQALRRLLPWPEAARFDELAPERLPLPSGSTARVEYPQPNDADGSDEQPVVSAKLQEVFGLAETPRLAGGRVPVRFHLLSPARRPLAVTSDLSSFWNGPYQEVRREMRGRYPKHPWPEDPWTAQATARTRNR